MFIVQTARGAKVELNQDPDWIDDPVPHDTIESARFSVVDRLLELEEREDRGYEFEHAWRELALEAMTIDAGERLAFDERAFRIVERVEKSEEEIADGVRGTQQEEN